MQNPKVSVIMNCYNSAQFLKEAIDSVYAQTFKDWEIIFWDNRSTDNSAEIAKGYDEKLRYFLSDTHTSLGAGRNAAIAKARGEYIAFLDCDDYIALHKLEKQVLLLDKNPAVGLIYTNYFVLRDEKKDIFLRKTQPEGNIFEYALQYYPIGILTVLLRKSILCQLDHLFDERLSLAEDYDFFLRISYITRVRYIHETLAYYRWHENMSTVCFRKEFPDEIIYVVNKLQKLFQLSKRHLKILERIKKREEIKKAVDCYLREGKWVAFIKIMVNSGQLFYFIYYVLIFLKRKTWRFIHKGYVIH